MNIAVVIPARYSSSRFPGKPLALILGKPMIYWVFQRVRSANLPVEIIVATDDSRIAKCVNDFGGIVSMTEQGILSGTERIWAALKDSKFNAFINVQGDEPLIDPVLIRNIYNKLFLNSSPVISAYHCNYNYSDYISPNVVKVVLSKNNKAMYFSRSPIPYVKSESFRFFSHHIGIYGYNREALKFFNCTAPRKLEMLENLEQIRFLENGYEIDMIEAAQVCKGVDTPEDLSVIEKVIEQFDHD